jgi:hypothetical protein
MKQPCLLPSAFWSIRTIGCKIKVEELSTAVPQIDDLWK